MRLVLTIDGERFEVEVDLEGSTLEIGGRTVPVRRIASEEGRTELEIAGERIVLDGWPGDRTDPRPRVSVNGEWVAAELVEIQKGTVGAVPPSPSSRSELPTAASSSIPAVQAGAGVPVFPPMPGRILEVQVTEGQDVAPGALLLVLEAMKMRNEITSPIAGRATDLAVTVGSSVRACDVLLRIVPARGSR